MKRLILFLFFMPLIATAQDLDRFGIDTLKTMPEGLPTGAYAPEISLMSSKGNQVSLKETLNQGPVVLIFYRGEWCPYCNRQMAELQDSLSVLTSLGATVFAVSPEKQEFVAEMVGKHQLGFEVLIDDTQKAMADYDLLFNVTNTYEKRIRRLLRTKIKERNQQEEAKLPVPAVYVISSSGKIAWRYFNYDYRQRPSVAEIAAALESLR